MSTTCAISQQSSRYSNVNVITAVHAACLLNVWSNATNHDTLILHDSNGPQCLWLPLVVAFNSEQTRQESSQILMTADTVIHPQQTLSRPVFATFRIWTPCTSWLLCLMPPAAAASSASVTSPNQWQNTITWITTVHKRTQKRKKDHRQAPASAHVV